MNLDKEAATLLALEKYGVGQRNLMDAEKEKLTALPNTLQTLPSKTDATSKEVATPIETAKPGSKRKTTEVQEGDSSTPKKKHRKKADKHITPGGRELPKDGKYKNLKSFPFNNEDLVQ